MFNESKASKYIQSGKGTIVLPATHRMTLVLDGIVDLHFLDGKAFL
jgi:hypothetical protein